MFKIQEGKSNCQKVFCSILNQALNMYMTYIENSNDFFQPLFHMKILGMWKVWCISNQDITNAEMDKILKTVC